MSFELKVNLLFVFLFFFAGCSALKNSQYEQYLSVQAEIPECLTDFSYLTNLRVTGKASFYKRGVYLTMQNGELKNMYQGNPLADPLPIRFAEVAVYDSNNKLIQCGSTNAVGNLKAIDGLGDLKIPRTINQFTVRVLARTNKTLSYVGKPDFKMHVAIKEDVYTSQIHYVSGSGLSNGIDNVVNLDIWAYARQTDDLALKGGAFNILNSIQTAYEYIQSNTGTTTTTCLGEKLNVFWKAGFNPHQYLYPTGNPSSISNGSYYNSADGNLYISGGRLGNISIETANHFDDFVIIHELGHFVENQCGRLSTPGGSHFLVARIDPRLAWSEGWANYFAGQVMYSSIAAINPDISVRFTNASLPAAWTYFFSAKGFSDTVQGISNGTGFMFDMKKAGSNPDAWQIGQVMNSQFDLVDPARYPGEGHFREGAITRGLFKLANNCGGTCITTPPISFQNIWKSMDKITGAGNPIFTFKDSHRALEILKDIVTFGNTAPANWSNYKTFNQATTSEALHLFSDGIFTTGAGVGAIHRWAAFGTPLAPPIFGNCSSGVNYIEPRSDDPVLTATNSDQRFSNQFFTLDLAAMPSVTQLDFTFTKQNPSGTSTEFDILLYGDGYFFTQDYLCPSPDGLGGCNTSFQPGRQIDADVLRSDRRAGFIATKTIKNLNLLDPTKKYLINVRAYTANKSISTITDYSYTITDQNGFNLCR